MPLPSPQAPPSRQGFALIVALAMMTLIVLVIVATSLIVKVDTQGSLQERSLAEARLNAMTGVNRAVGDLQTYAGPDQRTSARADIVSASADQPFWTGIWHTAPSPTGANAFEQGTAPMWLVSSESAPDPAAGPNASRAIELVRSTTGGNESVVVEKIALTGTGRESRGEFAYWVGDEGVKANVTVTEPSSYDGINADDPDQLLRLHAAHHSAWEELAGGGRRITADEAARLNSLRALPLLPGFALGTHFHDLTSHSLALLTDTKRGGLKEDLTRIFAPGFNANSAYADASPLLPATAAPMNEPTWGLLRSYHNLSLDVGAHRTLNPTVTVRPQTATTHGVHPLIAMLQMNWHARWVPSGSSAPPTEVVFAAQPVLTLVNPYNVSLASATYILRVRYDGSPKLILGVGSATSPSKAVDISIEDVFDSQSPQARMMMLRLPATSFAPGEAKIFSLAADVHYTRDLVPAQRIMLQPGLNLISSMTVGPSHAFSLAPSETPWLRLMSGKVLIQLYQGNQVHYVNDVYYATSHLGSYDLNQPTYIPNRMILRSSDRKMAAHGGTPHREDHQSGAKWLALYNPRARISNRDPNGAWISNPLFQGLWNAATEPDSYAIGSNGTNAYWGESTHSGQTHNVLFDIPRQPLISLGALQHANLSPQTWFPAYPFGNSWASPYYAHNARDFSYELNEAFWDRYFLSALPDGITAWPDPSDWLNPRLSPLNPLPEDSNGNASLPNHQALAGSLGVRGGFNINSTSTAAWSALLKSLQGMSVPVVDAETGALSTISTGTNIPFLRASLASGPVGDLWRGFRLLTPAQIDKLATEIVAVIREKGPFLSLANFVNRDLSAPKDDPFNLQGPLQVAIDRSGINRSPTDVTAPWNNTPEVPAENNRQQGGDTTAVNLTYPEASTGPRSTAAPGYLIQGDLLTRLAPALSARSDTFRIRAYGNTLNRATGKVEAEVWCEAIAQRLPEYVDPIDAPHVFPPTAAENLRFGRKFRIVSFRWLSPDEL